MSDPTGSRILEFQTFRLGETVRVLEYTGYSPDRIQAQIGPYHIWMTDAYTVLIEDQRILDQAEREARTASYNITEAAEVASALMQDRLEACTAAHLTEQDRVVALWAGAYLLIEGSRYITVEDYIPALGDD